MLRTSENSDVFNLLDEIYLVFTSKKQISSIYALQVHGLCGNFNDDPTDDFITADGRLVENPTQFAEAWRVRLSLNITAQMICLSRLSILYLGLLASLVQNTCLQGYSLQFHFQTGTFPLDNRKRLPVIQFNAFMNKC